MNDDTYTAPQHGWTCFHCGETFLKPKDARSHFGPTPDWLPECVERKTVTDHELLDRTRRAEQYAEDCQKKLDRATEEVDVLAIQLLGWKSLFPGALTAYDAWCRFHSMEGRALAAEAFLAEAEKHAPTVIAAAREVVCSGQRAMKEKYSQLPMMVSVRPEVLYEIFEIVFDSSLAPGDRLQRIASRTAAEVPRSELGYWQVSNGDDTKFLTIDPLSGFTWTEDSLEALHFARRLDAEKAAEGSDDAWHVRQVLR